MTAVLPMENEFHTNRFDSIQALRGIAALFVILEHVRFLNCGAFGVDIFFCISGFMMMFTTHNSTEHFFKKRLIRILPLYYLMTLVTFALLLLFPTMFEQTKADFSSLVKSLCFIPFDIGDGILQPLMRIGWTVNCEMFFYLLFFIAFHISHKYRGLICSGFLVFTVLLRYLLPTSFAPLRFYGDPIMLEFVLGMLGYYLAWGMYRVHNEKNLPKFLAYLAVVMALIIFALLILTKPQINILDYRRLLVWGIPALLIVLCFFYAGLYLKMSKWCVFVGNMSFSVYLIHYYPVMLFDRKVFDFSKCSGFAIFGVVLTMGICLVCSYVVWIIVEKKLTAWLRQKLG